MITSGMNYFILHGENRHTFTDAECELFESFYIMLMRNKETAKGVLVLEDGESKNIFDLQEGVETLPERSSCFSSDPRFWTRPHLDLIKGVFDQFKNLSELSKYMDLGIMTITGWKQSGRISFYRWRFLLEILGINQPLDRNNEIFKTIKKKFYML